jgi:O-antigen/teichoic acid export membrane protein
MSTALDNPGLHPTGRATHAATMPGSQGGSGVARHSHDEAQIAGPSRIVRSAGVVLAVQVIGAALAYGLQVLLARLLGASGYGIYTFVFVWVTFVSLLAGLGFPAASVRFVPVYRVNQDWPRLRGFVRATSRFTFATAIVTALGAIAIARVLHGLGLLGQPSAVVLGALLVPALAGSTLYTEFARASNKVGVAFAPALIARPALIGIGAGALFAAHGALSTNGALVVTLVAAYTVLMLQYALTRRLFSGPSSAHTSVVELREWFGVGVTLLAASAFVITLMQVDIVIVGAFRGARDAGIYAAASKTASLVAFVVIAVNAAAAPQFASLWALGRIDDLQRLVTKLVAVIFWPSLLISAGLAILSDPLLGLFGAEFHRARPALLILLASQVLSAAAGSVGYLLTLTGYHREATRAIGVSALTCVLLAVAGVWAFGLIGAALGSLVGVVIFNGSLYWLVVHKVGIHPSILNTVHLSRRRHGV